VGQNLVLRPGAKRRIMPSVRDTELYRHLLGIAAPWRVERVELDAKGQRIDVHLEHRDGQRWPCPECGHSCGLHDHAEERVWRHLDSCHFLTYVRARVPRVKCREHGVRLVSVPWAEAGSRFTLLFEALAIAVLQEASVSGAAHLLGLSWDEAHGIMQRAVKRGLAARKELDLKVIGVDEKSVGQGPRFFTMVYDHIGKRVVHIADGRGKASLESFFEELEAHQLTGIKAMAMDMSKAFIAVAQEALPRPEETMVFDRFHVMKAMNKAVDEVRREENKELVREGDRRLVGSMHIFRYAEENLPERYEARLDELKSSKLRTARAWAIKELLRELWRCPNLTTAETLWTRWYSWATRSQLEPVKKVASMVKEHITGILAYYKHRITNALAEGTNSKIEWIKNTARGYRNWDNLKAAILFHCGGLELTNVSLRPV
jgi:transposase